MPEEQDSEGFKERLSRQGEEALGRLAEELATNSVVSSAVASAFEARERAVAAQEAAMGALGIPSAADIERLTRRIRSVSQRLEGIEDALDRLDERLTGLDGLGERLEAAATPRSERDAIEQRLDELRSELAALRSAVEGKQDTRPRAGSSRSGSSRSGSSRSGSSRSGSSRSGSSRSAPGSGSRVDTGSAGRTGVGTGPGSRSGSKS